MTLRLVLFGSGSFAVPPFRTLLESEYDVAAVCTQPPRRGRGHHHHECPVQKLAEQYGVPVHQPARVNAPDALKTLTDLAADVFVVAAYGQILRPEFLAIPPLGAFNLHGSLLPRHRGAAPVQYAIWKGDQETGVTMFRIEPALDSGPIAGSVRTKIGPRETSGELMQRLAELSGPLTVDVLEKLRKGTLVLEPQDESRATHAPKITKDQGQVDWTRSAAEIDCHVRAMQPWPRAASTLISATRRLRCILLDVEPLVQAPTRPVGHIEESGKRLTVATGSGLLEIRRIQPEGKRALDAAAFVNGYHVTTDCRFS